MCYKEPDFCPAAAELVGTLLTACRGDGFCFCDLSIGRGAAYIAIAIGAAAARKPPVSAVCFRVRSSSNVLAARRFFENSGRFGGGYR